MPCSYKVSERNLQMHRGRKRHSTAPWETRTFRRIEADYADVQVALSNSQNETDEKQEACDAFAAKVIELRERSELLLTKTAALKQERQTRKKKDDSAKCSVLQSFQWREQNVDAVVLRGGVAFWAATAVPGEVDDEDAKRTSSKVRKQILQVIVAQGFNGELQDELEKDFLKRMRCKVFAVSKKQSLCYSYDLVKETDHL